MTEMMIPMPAAAGVLYTGRYASNGWTQLAYTVTNRTAGRAAFADYGVRLIDSGFARYAEYAIGEARFASFTRGGLAVHVMDYPAIGALRVVYGEGALLPLSLDGEPIVEPVVIQPGRRATRNAAAGQSYVIRAADGRLIVIDGGPAQAEDEADLLALLYALKLPADEKPRLLWIFTHPHSDHMTLANSFLAAHAEAIILEGVMYNFPDFGRLIDPNSARHAAALTKILHERYPDTPCWILHSGQRLSLPGCTIEILFTQEDFWPNAFPTANHTSAAWRLIFDGGRTFLVLGDCEKGLCAQMAQVYGAALESDILQLTHHGLNGATEGLYRLVNPKVCFWPLDARRVAVDGRCIGVRAASTDGGHTYDVYADPIQLWPGYAFNRWLRSTEWTRADGSHGLRQHFASSRTTTVRMTNLQITED